MEFVYKRTYRGPLKLAILDWAGTTMDYGCYAPAVVFIETFRLQGVEITMEEARRPMGLKKIDHIRAISKQPAVAERWRLVHGRDCTEEDVQRMFKDYFRLQVECIGDYAELIPGTLDAVAAMREMGMKIGSTSGYFTEAMEICLREAERQGYKPDASPCASDVPAGRPTPWMVLRNMELLEIYPPQAVVKIDDTKPGIEEGLNAGVWTIGLAKTGNEVGLNQQELEALPEEVVAEKVAAAAEGLRKTGAHFVVETIADVPPVLEEINRLLKLGVQP